MAALTHCRRCDRDVSTLDPWRGWRIAWRVWLASLIFIPFVALLALLDYFCTFPSLVMYLVSGGLIRGYANQKKICTRCSLEL